MMKLIDFHCHLLPQMDDGSKSVAQSLEMLSLDREQGVDTVVFTPHFYPTDESPATFLSRRADSFAQLQEGLASHPLASTQLFLGAEVAFYPGISKWDNLDSLCIQGTNLILLELPFTRWNDRILGEVDTICRQGFTPIIAHVERYFSFHKGTDHLDALRYSGALIQCNASFFLHFPKNMKALKMFRQGEIDLLGSDAHNMDQRKPNLGEAAAVISKKLGSAALQRQMDFGAQLLSLD